MGDVGDYWREHKAYRERKARGKVQKQIWCTCGKKWFSILDIERAKQHAANAKGEHTLISDKWDLSEEFSEDMTL